MTSEKKLPKPNNAKIQAQPQNLVSFERVNINSAIKLQNTVNFDATFSQKNKIKVISYQDRFFQNLIEKTTALIYVIQEEKICYTNQIALLDSDDFLSQILTNTNLYGQQNYFKAKSDRLNNRYSKEIQIKLNNNQDYWLNCSWETIEWNDKPAIMVTAFDITSYKHQAIELNHNLQTEKELCQSKSRFVSMVSHEFRTPLNIISFSTSLLKRHLDRWSKLKQLEYLNRLQTAIEQLSSLLDEVLIIGRAEAGKLKLDPQPLNLTAFCHQLLTEIDSSQTDFLGINLINLSKHETVVLDRNILKLVLLNLLNNGIKYSSDSKDAIEFVVFSKSNLLTFQITDRGIGIPLEEQSKIFEPFYRSYNVGEIPGHGLGLAIAKKLLELHSGKITLKSEVAVGSTFTIEIPLKLP
jgi:signal transduction histidine kinase